MLRAMTAHDDGAARLGEVALVDGSGRIGPLDTVFYDTLLDENAASHVALGAGVRVRASATRPTSSACNDEHDPHRLHDRRGRRRRDGHRGRRDRRETPVLRGGVWQL